MQLAFCAMCIGVVSWHND